LPNLFSENLHVWLTDGCAIVQQYGDEDDSSFFC